MNILYSDVYAGGARFYMTAQKDPYWVNLAVLSDSYSLTVVKQKPMEQQMTASAEGWAKQVEQAGRVSVYGVTFDTGKSNASGERFLGHGGSRAYRQRRDSRYELAPEIGIRHLMVDEPRHRQGTLGIG